LPSGTLAGTVALTVKYVSIPGQSCALTPTSFFTSWASERGERRARGKRPPTLSRPGKLLVLVDGWHRSEELEPHGARAIEPGLRGARGDFGGTVLRRPRMVDLLRGDVMDGRPSRDRGQVRRRLQAIAADIARCRVLYTLLALVVLGHTRHRPVLLFGYAINHESRKSVCMVSVTLGRSGPGKEPGSSRQKHTVSLTPAVASSNGVMNFMLG